jgi:hypothetical protein
VAGTGRSPVRRGAGSAPGQLDAWRGVRQRITVDPGSLRGIVVTPAQFAAMAGLLATTLGVTVEGQ